VKDGSALKQQAQELGIIDRIKFLGKVKDIDLEYAKAGIYVIPSRSEGFPNALAEAMGAGCSCIAFDFTAGPRDIIVDGISGLIIENGNTTEMAKAIDYLIAHPEKRMQLSKEAIKIREKLNENLIAEKIKRFINF
jgi:glycosyltransferase involved in cell wall biosynthesis